jgi:hypothetical protein
MYEGKIKELPLRQQSMVRAFVFCRPMLSRPPGSAMSMCLEGLQLRSAVHKKQWNEGDARDNGDKS